MNHVYKSSAKKPPSISLTCLTNNFNKKFKITRTNNNNKLKKKALIPIERYYEIDAWFNFVTKHPYIFETTDYYVFIQNIALNMAEYGLPIREFEHGILFILKYIEYNFLDFISSTRRSIWPPISKTTTKSLLSPRKLLSLPSSKVLNNVYLCVQVLASPVLEFCLEFNNTKIISKKYNILLMEAQNHQKPSSVCPYTTHGTHTVILYWKSFLFYWFSSYDAFELLCDNYISKASFETIQLVKIINIIVYDAIVDDDCCRDCLKRHMKKISESVLLAVINSPTRTFSFDSDLVIVDDRNDEQELDEEYLGTKVMFDVNELKHISTSILHETNDINTIDLCINTLFEKRYNMKNELYLAQYVICKTRDIVEVFSKRLELPNDICYYLLSEFVGYNLTDRGTLKKRNHATSREERNITSSYISNRRRRRSMRKK